MTTNKYQAAINLAQANFDSLRTSAILAIHDANLKLHENQQDQDLFEVVTAIMKMLLAYLETGDLESWKKQIVTSMNNSSGEPTNFQALIQVGGIVHRTVRHFFENNQHLLGTQDEPSEKVWRSLETRFNGLSALGISSITATSMKLKNAERNQKS